MTTTKELHDMAMSGDIIGTAQSELPDGLNIRGEVLLADDGWLYLYGGAQGQFAYLTGEKDPAP